MKIKYLFSGIIFLLLSACGGDATPTLSMLSDDAVILAFGDSLTHGNGANKDESYPAILQSLSGRSVINAGISGEESGPGLSRLPAALEKHEPSLLILCHGGNDLLNKRDKNQMESNIRAMIQLAKDKSIPVVMLGVPKPGLFLSSFELYKTIADSTDIIFLENLIPEVLGDKSLKSDTVHPNKEGYRMMAETIYASLQEAGAL
ncbi:MAG TPA: arylesterase [Thiotrichaceae bacterium]|jgi:lysophospholipase L1-like esterase|nr:arylesterase [Thiotrichaceae bacterium]HIM08326.1 arylesterase [Gammaproteobacteria bacterium]